MIGFWITAGVMAILIEITYWYNCKNDNEYDVSIGLSIFYVLFMLGVIGGLVPIHSHPSELKIVKYIGYSNSRVWILDKDLNNFDFSLDINSKDIKKGDTLYIYKSFNAYHCNEVDNFIKIK